MLIESEELLAAARRGMRYLAARQRSDGSWPYGEGRWQKWVDSFHSGFNLSALLAYQVVTGDGNLTDILNVGYEFYTHSFFAEDGTPKYLPKSLYPIDIHSALRRYSYSVTVRRELATPESWHSKFCIGPKPTCNRPTARSITSVTAGGLTSAIIALGPGLDVSCAGSGSLYLCER